MFQKTTLQNGLRILTIPTQGTKTVTVLILVKTGSRYETKNISGISHFLEHMFFKGTKKRPNTKQISEELDRVGGEFNAFTHKEYTGYYAKVASAHLDLALDVISDIFFNSKFDTKEIEREKGVIIEEINMYLDTPMRYVETLFEQLMYGNNPMGWDIAGDKQVIKDLARPQFLKYLNSNYLTKNTLVCVSGNIDKESIINKSSTNLMRKRMGQKDQELVLDKTKQYFKTTKNGNNPQSLPAKIINNGPKILIQHKETDQAHICLGTSGYSISDPRRFAFIILSSILGGYMSSRLWLSVRERQGLAYYVKSNAQLYTDTGYLSIQAGSDNKRVVQTIKTILKELKKITQKQIGASELNKAKENIKGGLTIELESSDALANFFGLQEILTGKTLTLEQIFAKIDTVTSKDILQVSRDILKTEKLKLAMIGPFKEKKQFESLLTL